MINVYKIVVGPLRTNCYVVASEKAEGLERSRKAIIIDPGDEADKIIDTIKENNLEPKQVVLTHDHFDHVGALDEIKKYFNIESPALKEGDKVELGDNVLEIIETPGHTEDGICIVCEKENLPAGEVGVIFTGDTLFKGTIGRTDLEDGSYPQIQESIKKLKKYPNDFRVYPGHGSETTIGEEKENNSYFK